MPRVVLTRSAPSRLTPHPARLRSRRISAEQALAHPYVQQFHDFSVERSADKKVTIPINDKEKKSTAVYRERLYHEVAKEKNKTRPAESDPMHHGLGSRRDMPSADRGGSAR